MDEKSNTSDEEGVNALPCAPKPSLLSSILFSWVTPLLIVGFPSLKFPELYYGNVASATYIP